MGLGVDGVGGNKPGSGRSGRRGLRLLLRGAGSTAFEFALFTTGQDACRGCLNPGGMRGMVLAECAS